MKIQILSDLHIECGDFSFDYAEADVIVLAGDIHTGLNGIEWARKNIKNKPVIYVLGNHEYYHCAYPKLAHAAKELTKGTQIHLLENDTIEIDSVKFYGCTLWTNFTLFGELESASTACEQQVLDYRKIALSPRNTKIKPKDTARIHNESIQWLDTIYDNRPGQKNVIVSHHAPSARSVPEQYKNAITSASYASNLDSLIEKLNPDLWIHGHMHKSFDYTVGSTRIICNPKGYTGENSQDFKPNCIVII